MSNTLTYKMLKEVVIKEMQLSLGLKPTGAEPYEKREKIDNWKFTTPRGKTEIALGWIGLYLGEGHPGVKSDDIKYWDDDGQLANIKPIFYKNFSENDFLDLLIEAYNIDRNNPNAVEDLLYKIAPERNPNK